MNLFQTLYFKIRRSIRFLIKLKYWSNNTNLPFKSDDYKQKFESENMNILLKYSKKLVNFLKSDFFMILCSFCEIFLFIFIILHAIYPSIWIYILVATGFLGLFYNKQDMFVYHPAEPPESKFYVELPTLYNLPYETVQLVTSDSVRLHSYLIKQQKDTLNSIPTLVLFHGNAVEYRGYGLSEGSACEKGFYKDAEASIKHLLSRSDIDTSKIVAYGQSIGGAVVIDLAKKFNDKLFAFIVENTFTSLPDIGRELFGGIPGVYYLPDFLFKNQYQSVKKIKEITVPGLFISGLSDTMIPPRMMKSLFDKSSSQMKRLLKIDEGNHNNTWLCPGYFQFILKFLQEIHAVKSRLDTDSNTDPNVYNISQIWHVAARTQN